MQIVQYPRTSTIDHKDKQVSLKSRLKSFRLGPQAARVVVVLLFTVCWLFVALVRSSDPSNTPALDSSSLIGLSTLLQQAAVSGRDFQSALGPGTQFMAWFATSLTRTEMPADAHRMMAFWFAVASAVLVAAMLLLCKRLSWKDCAIVYAFCFLLNLFFNIFDFRVVLLLLSAVCAYRITAAISTLEKTIWSTATGLQCFLAQLITFELGLYSVCVAVFTLIAGTVLTRRVWNLLAIEIVVATLAACNVALVLLFKLTSSQYALLFDYQNYSIEILRAYHNTMGIVWQLPLRQTIALIIPLGYVVGRCVVVARKGDPLDGSLLAGLTFAAVIWVKTAFVTSDTAHIVTAFTPTAVILALLATRDLRSKHARVAWLVAMLTLLLVWPSFNLQAPADIVQLVRGKVPLRSAVQNLYAPQPPAEASVIAMDGGRENIPILTIPFDTHLAARARRPFFAPVLETYDASTGPLERYYIEAVDKRRQQGLDVIYESAGLFPRGDGIQSITRTPRIFEYLYRNFEFIGNQDRSTGSFELRQRREPREIPDEPLQFSVPQQLTDSGTLRLSTASACGVIKLQVRLRYNKSPLLFRPSGVQLTMRGGGQTIWTGSVRPLETNETFTTYISPLPQATFHTVFGPDPVAVRKWDEIEYRYQPAGLLGARPTRITVEAIQCLDPEKFIERERPLSLWERSARSAG
jgi:hypothetical protein